MKRLAPVYSVQLSLQKAFISGGMLNLAAMVGKLLNCINNPAERCHAMWQWKAQTPAT